jgi:uncharacterized protein (DUF433 family)
VEHILAMLAAGDSVDAILKGYPWPETEDIQACLVYARRVNQKPSSIHTLLLKTPPSMAR